jgi:hypothetical protein
MLVGKESGDPFVNCLNFPFHGILELRFNSCRVELNVMLEEIVFEFHTEFRASRVTTNFDNRVTVGEEEGTNRIEGRDETCGGFGFDECGISKTRE